MAQTRDFELKSDGTTAGTDEGSLLFVGNATVLMRLGPFTILTDPTFIHMHEQAWIGYGMHTTRLTNPALEIVDLPPLDFIVLSHFHGDHFDQVAERDLDKDIPIVTTPAAATELAERGFRRALPLDTWQSITFWKGEAGLRITAAPGRHGPPVVSFALPTVMGSILELVVRSGDAGFKTYITGDTLIIEDIREIPERFPGIDLALLHLGGTTVMGVMLTMDGKQGVEMMRIVHARHAIPIHFDDYDVFKSPLSDLLAEVQKAGLQDIVTYLDRGETYSFSLSPGR